MDSVVRLVRIRYMRLSATQALYLLRVHAFFLSTIAMYALRYILLRMTTHTRTWRPGEQARLARTAGVSPQHLSDILHCRRHASAEVATALEFAAHGLGIPLGRDDFVWPEHSISPLISQQPVR